jgi:ribosome-associated protein
MAKKKIANIELKDAIVNGMLEKKANDITILDLKSLQTSMADYFVICHGNSDKQVNAIADSVEDTVRKQTGEKPWHIEGAELGEWILIDYFDVVVHIFKDEKRAFYGIEELWSDAVVTRIDDQLVVAPKAKVKAKAKAKAKTSSKKS